MHVDASVMVAVLVGEPDRLTIIERLEAHPAKFTSLVSAFETAIAVGRKIESRGRAVGIVRKFLSDSEIAIDAGDGSLLEDLADVHARYGKGSGHPAKLNLGDCFSYAMAKRAGVPLLYKGKDFARTDLA